MAKTSDSEVTLARVSDLESRLRRVGDLLAMNGCDCECDHSFEEHDFDCTRCLACLISITIGRV